MGVAAISDKTATTMTACSIGPGDDLRHEVCINGRHLLYTDEPASIGGTDTAPAPHELLPAALASCISTMVALYAKRRDWDIGEIRVDVAYDHRAEPREFDVTVELPEGLTSDQVERLTKVAQTCPVKRAFEAGFVVRENVI
jgi:putative redox protein